MFMEEQTNYEQYNAPVVLEKLEQYIAKGYSQQIRNVCEELSIFDWWVDTLSVTKMKQMRTFLKNAIDYGFKGYVCFKVGAKGCANGMWVSKAQSTNGYSPNGDCLYRSFTPDYTCYDAEINGNWLHEKNKWNEIKTFKDLVSKIEMERGE